MFTEWRMKVECEGFTDPVEEEYVEEPSELEEEPTSAEL